MSEPARMYKAIARLADIVPSEDNPRKDFGDLEALANKMRATGGRPINPIVCVRDGERWRIVDGERRYRALLTMYPEDEQVEVVAFDDYSDAHAAVAMLATDDKKQLSQEEQARGFQTMMRLDVPMADAVHATGIGAEELHRARRSMAAAGRLAACAQATMDGLIAAGAEEFSEEERERILSSKWPEDEASEIHKSHQRADKLAAMRLSMPDRVEFAERGASTKGLLYVTEVRTAKAARELELEDGKDYVAIPPTYERATPTWKVYERMPEGEDAPSEDEVRRARAAEERAEHDALLRHMRTHMLSWLLNNLYDDKIKPISEKAKENRTLLPRYRYDLDESDTELLDGLEGAFATGRELAVWLDRRVRDAKPKAWSDWYYAEDELIVETWDLLASCGWEPDDECDKVLKACKR